MVYQRKQLERRTYSQDRYYALIKRQKAGKATFKELTELDEIVNRVPDIREIVIRESFMIDEPEDIHTPANGPENNEDLPNIPLHQSLWIKIKSFIIHAFTMNISATKPVNLAPLF